MLIFFCTLGFGRRFLRARISNLEQPPDPQLTSISCGLVLPPFLLLFFLLYQHHPTSIPMPPLTTHLLWTRIYAASSTTSDAEGRCGCCGPPRRRLEARRQGECHPGHGRVLPQFIYNHKDLMLSSVDREPRDRAVLRLVVIDEVHIFAGGRVEGQDRRQTLGRQCRPSER